MKRRGRITVGDTEVDLVKPKLPLYHGTSSKRVRQIMKEGLCTPESCHAEQLFSDVEAFENCRSKAIYVSPEKEVAWDYAKVAAELRTAQLGHIHGPEKPVVIEIKKLEKGCIVALDPEIDADREDENTYQLLIAGCDCIRPKNLRVHRRL